MLGLPHSSFLKLSQEDFQSFGKVVANEEIKATLFDMAPLKASKSDDFLAYFFQSQWVHVRSSVCG